MTTYYLIDYENVRNAGLDGCQRLTADDHVIVFYTAYADQICMDVLTDHGEAGLQFIKTPCGAQMADIHIDSYLGYILGKNSSDCRVCIVSRDQGYDVFREFWSTRLDVSISRSSSIHLFLDSQSPETTDDEPDLTDEAAPPECAIALSDVVSKPSGEERSRFNQEIMNALHEAGYVHPEVGQVAKTAVKNMGTRDCKKQTYLSLISMFGMQEGLELYNCIKGIL